MGYVSMSTYSAIPEVSWHHSKMIWMRLPRDDPILRCVISISTLNNTCASLNYGNTRPMVAWITKTIVLGKVGGMPLFQSSVVMTLDWIVCI